MKRIDIVGVCFVLLCIGFCGFGLSKIQSNTEDVLQWLPDQSEARTQYDLFESMFGSDDFLVVTWRGCHVDDPRLESFTELLRQTDTQALFQYVVSGSETLHRLTRELKVSRAEVQDRLRGVFFGVENPELTCVMIELSGKGTANRVGSMNLVWNAIDSLPELKRADISMGGYPYVATFIDNQLKNSFRNFLVPSVVLATLIALCCLRNIALTLIVFLTAVGAAATSIAFIPICDMKYGGLMSIIPALVFVLAISGSIHLIRYSLEAIGDRRKLLAIGWRPCAVSAATTAVGMLSLLRSDFPAIRNFGLFCASGVGFALLFQLVMVPWLLERFGAVGLRNLDSRSEHSSFWTTLISKVQRRKYVVSGIFLLLILLGGIGLTKLTAEVEVEKLFQANSEILLSIADMESRLGPMDQTELLVMFQDDGTEQFKVDFPVRVDFIRRVQAFVSRIPEVDVIYSLVNFLPDEPRKTNARSFFKRSTYWNVLRRERMNMANSSMLHLGEGSETWRISLRFPFTQEKDFESLQRNVIRVCNSVASTAESNDSNTGESDSASTHPQFIYTGKTHLFHHAQLKLLTDLFQNFLLAFVIITPMLIIVLRSVSLGLMAMLPNLFPTLIVFGGLGWAGSPVDLAIAMTACVALGIAVDDTTHFLIRFCDYGGRLDNVSGPIVKTIAQCGPAMFHTTLIGGAGLSVYYFSSMLVVSRFSWSIATLLVIALLADVLMLPAILFVFGRDEVDAAKEEPAPLVKTSSTISF